MRYNNRSGRTLAATRAIMSEDTTTLCAIEHHFIAVFPAPSCRCQRRRHAMVTTVLGYKGRHFEIIFITVRIQVMLLSFRNLDDTFALKHYGYTQILLRFQMCAVVICCSPHSPPEIRNAVCRHDHRQATSVDDNFTHSHIRRRHHDRRSTRIANTLLVFSPFATTTANLETQTGQIFRRQLHAFTDPPAPPRSPFNSRRNAASPKPVAVLHLRLRYPKSGMPRVVTITDEPNLSAATSRIHTSAGAVTVAVQLASKRDIAKALQGQPDEFGATSVLLSNTRVSDVTAAAAGIK